MSSFLKNSDNNSSNKRKSDVIDLTDDNDNEQKYHTTSWPSDFSSSTTHSSIRCSASPSTPCCTIPSSLVFEKSTTAVRKKQKSQIHLKSNNMDENKKKVRPGVEIECHGMCTARTTRGIINIILSSPLSFSLILLKNSNNSECLKDDPIHFEQRDKWSCGYRNVQMLMSCLLPYMDPVLHPYCALVGDAKVPSLLRIQEQLEMAWSSGFDPAGAQHFNNSLANTQKKIGAIEVLSLLNYWYIDATAIQFSGHHKRQKLIFPFIYYYFTTRGGTVFPGQCDNESQNNSSNTNSESWKQSMKIFKLLKQRDYKKDLASTSSLSSGDDNDLASNCHSNNFVQPLYLQWEGHSITIVGIEKKNVVQCPFYNLILFDPNVNLNAPATSKNKKNANPARDLLKRMTVNPISLIGRLDAQIILTSSTPLCYDIRERYRKTLNCLQPII